MSFAAIKSTVEYFLQNESDTYAKMFLIYTSGHQELFKKFHASTVEISNDFKHEFNSIIKTALKDISTNYNMIKKFSDPENTNNYRTIGKSTLPELEGLLEELETQKDVSPITGIDEMRKQDTVYCFQFKTRDKRIFVFAKIGKYVVPENKKNIVGEFKNNKLEKRTDEFVVFEKDVFGIYFEEAETLLMIDYSATKELLKFKSQIKKRCTQIISDELNDLLSFDANNLNFILKNNTVNETLLKMYYGDAIDRDKSHYKKME